MIERHAWTKRIDKRKALMLNAAFDELDEMFYLSGEAARHVGGPGCNGQGDRIDGIFDASSGGALCFHSFGARGRDLSGGEAVNLIVHDDIRQIDVSSHGMNKMITADA